MISTMASPYLAYEFPCSYLGNPLPIQSALPFAAFGALLPPVVTPLQNASDTNSNISNINSVVTATDHANYTTNTNTGSKNENDLPSSPWWLSCPRRTIDGTASETILESENNVASLVDSFTTDTITRGLTVEVWFTPVAAALQVEGNEAEEEQRLLPIVSIATPVSERSSETLHHNDGRQDLCDGTQFSVGQRGDYLELRYRDHYEYLPDRIVEYDDDDDYADFFDVTNPPIPQYSCRVLRLTQWKLGDDERVGAIQGLHHLVVAWKRAGSVLQVFGNGNLVVDIDLLPGVEKFETNIYAGFLRHWDPSFKLQVFSDSPRWSDTRVVATNNTATEKVPINNETDTDSGFNIPGWFEDMIATNNTTKTDTGNNVTDDQIDSNTTNGKVVFPGAIHKIALYKQGLNEDTVKTLYDVGVEKREDPLETFLQDPNNLFQQLRLNALSASSSPEEEESNNDVPFPGIIVTQGSFAPISVGASEDSNITTALWDVLVEIMDLPKYGSLVYHYNETKITARVGGMFLIKEGKLRTQLEYRNLQEDYFSVPKHSYHGTILHMADLPGESFSYRLIATKNIKGNILLVDGSASRPVVLGQSEPVRQELTIVHKNHLPVLVGLPEEVLQPEWQPSGIGARPWATLGANVVLNDEKDHDIDRVRLDLWAYEGTLTIDMEITEIQDIAEITACSNPKPTTGLLGGDWVCDGINDRNMTLMATPTDVSRILSNLRYNALHWERSDSIVLRIHDGCPEENDYQQQQMTIRDECFSIAVSVEVPPLSKPVGGPSEGNIWRDHRSFWISLVVFLIILSTCCCCAISCWKRCRKIKKLNDIAVADDCDHHVVVLASPDDGFPSSLEITEKDRRAAAANCTDRLETTMHDSV
jgi:hypothetical protein